MNIQEKDVSVTVLSNGRLGGRCIRWQICKANGRFIVWDNGEAKPACGRHIALTLDGMLDDEGRFKNA